MTKLAAVALILALPALVAADINRLRPSADLERPDALPRSVWRQESGLTRIAPVLPGWEGVCPSSASGHQMRSACPVDVLQHVARCLSDPYCREKTRLPILWPDAPRVDEQKTAGKEPRREQAQVQDEHPVN